MQNPGFPENDLTFESLPQIYVRGDHGKDPQAHGMGLDSKLVILQTNLSNGFKYLKDPEGKKKHWMNIYI